MLIEKGRIESNRSIARNLWQLEVRLPEIAARAADPGQFLEILVESGWEHPLRRPMSIAGIREQTVTVIYKIMGTQTGNLSRKKAGDVLNVLGPLGNGFRHSGRNGVPVLVGGGTGVAPVLWLHQRLREQQYQHHLVIGARTRGEHFLEPDPRQNLHIASDDGSLGYHGTVLPVLEQILGREERIHIYACGPVAMLKALQTLCAGHRIPAQVSVESYMACGVGLCQGCAIRTAADPREQVREYSLVCREGPVYDIREIGFD